MLDTAFMFNGRLRVAALEVHFTKHRCAGDALSGGVRGERHFMVIGFTAASIADVDGTEERLVGVEKVTHGQDASQRWHSGRPIEWERSPRRQP